MMRISDIMRKFSLEKRGSILELGGVLIAMLVIVLGFVVDTGLLYYTKIKLGKISEAAAISSVLSAPNSSAMIKAAVTYASQNAPMSYGIVTTTDDIAVGFFDSQAKKFTANRQPYNAIKVVASRAHDHGNPLFTFFPSFLNRTSSDVRATSYAVRYGGICVWILSTASTAFSANGNGTLNANCPVQINGTASTKGSVSVQAPYACIGGTSSGPGWSVTPAQGCGILPDPLQSTLAEPSASSCTYTNASLSGNLSPGTYCFFNQGEIKLTGNSAVTGNGVALFFDAQSYLTVDGNSSLTLSAPTNGPLAGVTIFQTRTPSASSNTFTFGGGGTLSINGLIYLPASNLQLNGNAGSTQNYSQLVSLTLKMKGTPTYNVNSFSNQRTPSAMLGRAALFVGP